MTVEEAVAHLRRIYDEGRGLVAWKEAFDGLAAHGRSVIRPLLLMRPYSESDNYHHEMFAVIHLIEGFPDEVYYAELLGTVPELSRSSPYFLDLLLARIFNISPSNNVEFRRLAKGTQAPVRGILRAVVEKLKLEPEQRKLVIGNCDLVLSCLDEDMG